MTAIKFGKGRNQTISYREVCIFALCYKNIGITVTITKSHFISSEAKNFPSLPYGLSAAPVQRTSMPPYVLKAW
jgi:hypothetical protein